jgi:transcriptional regulator with XRE-family HTH domain
MNKPKIKGTLDRFLESLSPEARQKYEEGYKELLISEMIIAAMENDEVSVRKLAKKAGISPTTVQNLQSGISDSGVKSLFKVFKSLGYSIFAEKGDERLPLLEVGLTEESDPPASVAKTRAKPVVIKRHPIVELPAQPMVAQIARKK